MVAGLVAIAETATVTGVVPSLPFVACPETVLLPILSRGTSGRLLDFCC